MDQTLFRRVMNDIFNAMDALENMQALCGKGFHPPSQDAIQKARFSLYEIVMELHAARAHTIPK